MENDQFEKKAENIFSKKVRAGKRRTYFFDVVATRNMDYYLVITESKKRLDGNGFDRHKVFLYKEDFNKFLKGLNETVDHIKTELMPDFNFESFDYEDEEYVPKEAKEEVKEEIVAEAPKTETPPPADNSSFTINHEEVDNW